MRVRARACVCTHLRVYVLQENNEHLPQVLDILYYSTRYRNRTPPPLKKNIIHKSAKYKKQSN